MGTDAVVHVELVDFWPGVDAAYVRWEKIDEAPMKDSEKDWHAAALTYVRREAPNRQARRVDRLRALACALHHGGEGWSLIRKLLPELDDGDMLDIVKRTT